MFRHGTSSVRNWNTPSGRESPVAFDKDGESQFSAPQSRSNHSNASLRLLKIGISRRANRVISV
jgi:hypothetical protein